MKINLTLYPVVYALDLIIFTEKQPSVEVNPAIHWGSINLGGKTFNLSLSRRPKVGAKGGAREVFTEGKAF